MINRADVDKLLTSRATLPTVLSLYLHVPLDPAELRGLQAKLGELVSAAERAYPGGVAEVGAADRMAVHDLLAQHARDWLGRTVAFFTCGELGLAEAITLPGTVPERAVVATRPHVRPLLVAIQRWPAYHVAVVGRGHAWVFKVDAERIETLSEAAAQTVRSPGFGGWYGLDSYRIHERVIQLTRRHYRETAAILEQVMRAADFRPLAVGGHDESVSQFLAVLPAWIRDRFAGSFVADPHTLTPARVRKLAAPVIERWVAAREKRLVAMLGELPPGELAATGLDACAAAVNEHAVRLLVLPDDGLIPGFGCQRCGALATTRGDCPACGAVLGGVPDLLEEMAARTLGDGALVEAAPDPPGGLAAQLRFPLPADQKR